MQAVGIAEAVLSQGLQNWGQSVDDRVLAWQGAFDFMNLSVTLRVSKSPGRKVFLYDGVDADKAKAFMEEVRERFPLGQFEEERAMVEDCLKRYTNAQPR